MNKKKIEHIAKSIYKLSLTNGELDNVKIKKILAKTLTEKPYGLSKILKTYKRFISEKDAWETVIIQSTQKLDQKTEKQIIKDTSAKRVSYLLTPQMVFGVKITHGDWIHEQSLESKIKQII